MRTARMLGHGTTFYHAIGRVNHGEYLLDDTSKERLVGFIRDAETLGLGKVVTYAILDTHFHILLQIDHGAEVAEEEVVKRVRARYGDFRADELLHAVEQAREAGNEAHAQAALERYRWRMNSLAEFMKDVQQRFTMSYNKRHGTRGHFWCDRYKSLVVEGRSAGDVLALAVIAGYIDLNCVRAAIVTDPAKYRFCGYGAAQAGDQHALNGLRAILTMISKKKGEVATLAAYRRRLFRQGFDHATKGSMSEAFRKLAKKVEAKEGRLSQAELMFCRVRYFSDGVAIGSRGFIEDLFSQNRRLFSPKRKTGARSFRYADSGGLFGMRDLRLDPISVARG